MVGKIASWDDSANVYKVEYEKVKTKQFNERTILEPVLIARLEKSAKISIYSYSDNSFYDAEIKEVDDSKLDNFKADFESGMSEWIDIRRYKYHILSTPSGKIPKTYVDSNIAAISASQTAATSLDSKGHPFPNVRNVDGPAPSNVAFVDKGTVIAMRWKRPYILYDATVVKMKDDGSQYLLQYHYDSCTKWIDLRKAEFYIIGVDQTFADATDDGPSATRATRRARKSEPAAMTADDSNPRKRRRAGPPAVAAATEAAEDTKPTSTETAQMVDESDIDDFQADLLKQISVGTRVAIWSRNKEWRKATVMSFGKNRVDFEIQYDGTDKHTRINLEHNPFLILQPTDANGKPEVALSEELANHANPDIGLIDIGTKVSVLWEGDSKFYPATVTKKREGDEPFFLEYEDGDQEWIDLNQCKFKIDS